MTAELDSARTAGRPVDAGDGDAPLRRPRALGARLTQVFLTAPTRPLTLYNSGRCSPRSQVRSSPAWHLRFGSPRTCIPTRRCTGSDCSSTSPRS